MWGRWTPRVNLTRVSSRQRSGRWLLGLLPVLGLSVVLTACGGTSASTASPTTSTRPASTGQGAAGSRTGASGSGAPASGAGSAAFTKYTQCLTSHGVPSGTNLFGRRGTGTGTGSGSASSNAGSGGAGLTGGAGGPGGSTPAGTRPTIPAQYQKAFQDCASLRPTGGFGGFGAGLNSAQAAAYRNCLQIHGVTLPTPPTTTPGQPPSTGGAGRGNGFAQLRNNPAYQAAAKACASLLPARPGSPSTTTPAASA
jgi:hypothetical protein